MKTHSNSFRAGWTRTELLVAIVFVAMVVGALLLPALAQAKKRSSRIHCVNCLKQIGTSFRLWAGDSADKYPMQVSVTNGGTLEAVSSGRAYVHFQAMSNELSTPKILVCPGAADRSPATNFLSDPAFAGSDFGDERVSYFVGVDAELKCPQVVLSGDRQLTIGPAPVRRGLVSLTTNMLVGWKKGIHATMPAERRATRRNVVLVDGSVRTLEIEQLRKVLLESAATNRLAIP